MNNRIKEIISKDDSIGLDQEEMIFVVEQYIYEKKKKRVNIVFSFDIMQETQKLHHAFNVAKGYFLKLR